MNEKVENDAFLDQLWKCNFDLLLHGHIHESRNDLIGYLHPNTIHLIGAGTFTAPHKDRPESTPRLYNLLEIS